MDRRTCLTLLGSAALAPVIARASEPPDDWAAAFARARAGNPWLMGWDTVAAPAFDCPELRLDGALPPGLAGRFRRTGPARHEIGGRRYHHWFDGDGMAHDFTLGGGRVGHRGRMVATAKYTAETAAGRMLESAFGTLAPGNPRPPSPDALNTANINILSQGGRLLALWEGGSAYELDPADLTTRGTVAWSRDLSGLPFSAHPRRDTDGSLWNFGVVPYLDRLVVYRLDPAGALAAQAILPLPDPCMVHDFVLTARHLVIPLAPYVFDRARAGTTTFLDAHAWRPERGTRVLILPKDDLTNPRLVELPAGWVFHYGNGWEEADGTIRFDAARYDDPSLMTGSQRLIMRGEVVGTPTARLVRVTLPPRGEARIEPIGTIDGEFPVFDPRSATRRHRRLYLVGRGDGVGVPGYGAVVAVDVESGAVDRFVYPGRVLVEEHVFVPRPGGAGDGDGWLIGTSLDIDAGATRLAVFDAERVSAGPVALARLPYALPLGLHGSFDAM